MKLIYKVRRGKCAGSRHEPHRYEDGTFVVSKSKFVRDYKYVRTLEEVVAHLKKGYRVRVSNPATGESPSLVREASIIIVR